jgi:hypothetical protein
MKYNDEDVEKESDILRFILSIESYRDLDAILKEKEKGGDGDGGSKKRHSEDHYYKKLTSSR